MFNEQTPAHGRMGADGKFPYGFGLFGMLVIGTFGVMVAPASVFLTVTALLGVALIAGIMLVTDTPEPTPGYHGEPIYPMRGRDAMDQLYAEIERRSAEGELFPFGNWLPRFRVQFEAQQAIRRALAQM